MFEYDSEYDSEYDLLIGALHAHAMCCSAAAVLFYPMHCKLQFVTIHVLRIGSPQHPIMVSPYLIEGPLMSSKDTGRRASKVLPEMKAT